MTVNDWKLTRSDRQESRRLEAIEVTVNSEPLAFGRIGDPDMGQELEGGM